MLRLTFDAADRITASGYAYDTLGRTLTVPAADAVGTGSKTGITGALAVGYFANDMVATQTQGAATRTYTLDPHQDRIAAISDGTAATTPAAQFVYTEYGQPDALHRRLTSTAGSASHNAPATPSAV